MVLSCSPSGAWSIALRFAILLSIWLIWILLLELFEILVIAELLFLLGGFFEDFGLVVASPNSCYLVRTPFPSPIWTRSWCACNMESFIRMPPLSLSSSRPSQRFSVDSWTAWFTTSLARDRIPRTAIFRITGFGVMVRNGYLVRQLRDHCERNRNWPNAPASTPILNSLTSSTV